MNFRVTSAKVLGSPAETRWAQVHDFTPQDADKLQIRGRLFAVISFEKKEGEEDKPLDAVVFGREILSRLHEEYYGKLDSSAFNALEKAVAKTVGEFEDSGKIQIAAASVIEDVLYVAAGGGAQAFLFRGGGLAPLIESGQKAVAASGRIQKGDLFMLTTSGFLEKLGRGVVKAAISNASMEDIAEDLGARVRSQSDAALASVVIGFSEMEAVPSITAQVKEEKDSQQAKRPSALEAGLRKLGNLKRSLSRGVFVKRRQMDVEDLQKRKSALSIGFILLVILLVSIVFGVRQKQRRDLIATYEPRLLEAEHNLDEAESLFSISPDRARELFSLSGQIVSELEEKNIKDGRLEALRERLRQGREVILGEYEIPAELFLDPKPISDNFVVNGMTSSGETIFLLDVSGKRVAKVEIDTKRTEVISGPAQLSNPEALSSYEERAFVLEDGSIYEVGDTKIESVEADFGGNTLFSAYAGNLYVLDKEASDILRFAGVGVDFGEGRSWLAAGIEPDFSKIVSMAIDGAIWLLSESGNFAKYSFGNPQNLADFSLFPPLSSPVDIYTNESLEGVYILDPTNSRVVVLDKEGGYKAQYKGVELASVQSIVVSESEGIIIFLSENKLFSVGIKH